MRLRQLYLWHRYFGIALCLLFAIWFVSGIAMMYVRMPILFPADRFAYLPPFDPVAVRLTPAEAAETAGLTEPPRRMRLVSLLDRPIYFFLPRGERWRGVYADSGERLRDVSPDVARRIAAQAYPGSSPQYVRTVDTIDQWTLTNSLNLQRPLHRIAIDDNAGTEIYVSSVTGEIVMRTTRRERALAWIGPIVHWGAPEILRTRVALWRQSVLWVSFAGIALVLTGLCVGLMRYRRRGYQLRTGVSTSPYTGWKRWHHWGGLVFGTVTLTWMVSGWLYLNPGGGRSGPLETITTMSPYNVGGVRADNSSRPEHAAALTGGPLDPGLFATPPDVVRSSIPDPIVPREIELTRVGGNSYFIVYADWDRSWIVPAEAQARSGVQTRFDERTLASLAARMIPDSRLTEARLVHEYDAYYYSVGSVAPKRLPVFLAKFDDPESTWYYIDPYSGSIFRRYDRYGRVMRWMVNGLHTLDFPLLFANRPAWDLAIIGLSAGGLALSLTGIIIGWRRVSEPLRRRREEPLHARRIA
jgi:uncharacterized iron-regulated membrane protein